jgi:HSP20 family molecular chaperone IbpA
MNTTSLLDVLTSNKNIFNKLNNYDYSYVLTTKKEDSYLTKFNVAGFEKDEIKIEFAKKSSGYNRVIKVIATNEEFGSVKFLAEVPNSIDEKSVKAKLKNGILTISCFEEKIKSTLTSLTIQVE